MSRIFQSIAMDVGRCFPFLRSVPFAPPSWICSRAGGGNVVWCGVSPEQVQKDLDNNLEDILKPHYE
jgi:hypothetical protein